MKRSGNDMEKEIAALCDLSREDLAAHWQKAHGSAPPKGIRQNLLVRSAAWHCQVKRLGGLSPTTRRALKAEMADVERSISPQQSVPDKLRSIAASDTHPTRAVPGPRRRHQVVPGTRLIRDWNGKSHMVDVIETGFVFQAKVYTSLTAIAHQITGAQWSGPRFFGL